MYPRIYLDMLCQHMRKNQQIEQCRQHGSQHGLEAHLPHPEYLLVEQTVKTQRPPHCTVRPTKRRKTSSKSGCCKVISCTVVPATRSSASIDSNA